MDVRIASQPFDKDSAEIVTVTVSLRPVTYGFYLNPYAHKHGWLHERDTTDLADSIIEETKGQILDLCSKLKEYLHDR